MKKIAMIFCILFLSVILLTISCEEQNNTEPSAVYTPTEPVITAQASELEEVKTIEVEIEQPAQAEKDIETPAVKQQAAEVVEEVVEAADTAAEAVEQKITDPSMAVIAIVNGQNITKGQIDELVLPNVQERTEAGQAPSEIFVDNLYSRALDFLIGETAKTQIYEKYNITVSDEEIIAEIKRVISKMDPPMTIEDFNETLYKVQKMTINDLKPVVGQEKKSEKLVKIMNPGNLDANDMDARTIYNQNIRNFQKPDQVRASHILIAFDMNLPADQAKTLAKQKADGLLKQIKEENADFAKLAKENSADLLSAKEGGDLGFFAKQTMAPAFANAAFAMQPGEISDVIETQYGYHIIKVTDKEAAHTKAFESVKEGLKEQLTKRKIALLAKEIMDSVKINAEVVYPPDSTIRAYQNVSSQIRKPQNMMQMGSTPQ